jgi:Na+-transporting NADH:ubiquinone oxidoreductase subunit B
VKALLKLFERHAADFDKGGRFSALKPVFKATEHFFFAPAETTVIAPHSRDPLDVKRFMSVVIIALLPCVIASFYLFGLRLAVMLVVSYIAGGVVEVTFAIVRKEQINEGFLVTGLLFPLILPPTLPLWLVAVGVIFGVFVGKELFGGTGRNLFNPALVGRCFLSLAYPAAMAGHWLKPGSGLTGRLFQYIGAADIDALSTATPLVMAKQGNLVALADMFWGQVSGSMGETSAFAIILGGLFLLLTRVANWRTVVSILGSAAVMTALLHRSSPEILTVIMWNLCAGGLLFGAFFMATDPVTSPATDPAKYAYGIIIGVATLLIRNFTGYVEGVTFAILLGNIVAPLLDEIVIAIRIRRLANEG